MKLLMTFVSSSSEGDSVCSAPSKGCAARLGAAVLSVSLRPHRHLLHGGALAFQTGPGRGSSLGLRVGVGALSPELCSDQSSSPSIFFSQVRSVRILLEHRHGSSSVSPQEDIRLQDIRLQDLRQRGFVFFTSQRVEGLSAAGTI